MDIDALHSALLSLTVLPEQIRAARESVAAVNGGATTALGEFLNTMERDLRMAKATLARELGFTVCHCCWPPELMATDANGRAHCPASPKTAPAINIPNQKRIRAATVRNSAAKGRRLDSFKRAQKDKLLGLRDTLVDSITGVAKGKLRPRESGAEAPAFVGDRADAGSDASERNFALSLLSQEQDALFEIDQALKRIESSVYGICEISGKLIPRERLEAIPFARYTVECQAQIEKQRKATRARQPVMQLFDLAEEEGNLPYKERIPTLAQRIVTLERAERARPVRRLADAFSA